MVAAVAADLQAQGGDLVERARIGTADIHTRRTGLAYRLLIIRGQHIDHRRLDGTDQLAHLDVAAPQIDQQVDHHLTRTVIGHLAAAVGLHDRDVGLTQQVFTFAGQAQGVHRRVFDHPQFIGRIGRARVGEGAHGGQRLVIIDPPKLAHQHDRPYSAMTTIG